MLDCLGLSRKRIALPAEEMPDNVEVLILGTGWTGSFLIPRLYHEGVSFASTTRDGKDGSIPFAFDPASHDTAPFQALPNAKTIVIVFPIYESGGSERLLKLYNQTHPDAKGVRWIQLGSTGIWDGGPTLDEKKRSVYIDRHSPINLGNKRASAEEELLKLHTHAGNKTCVLNLCGLWGGPRSMRRYVGHVAGTKEQLAAKGSIHMVHGLDVARAILGIHQAPEKKVFGERWLLTDLRVYDWWELASKWGDSGEEGRGKPMTGPQAQWVTELMRETGTKSLPRSPEQLGKGLCSLEFWETIGISPIMGGQLD